MDANYLRGMHHFSNGGDIYDGHYNVQEDFSQECGRWIDGWKKLSGISNGYYGSRSFIRGMKYKQSFAGASWRDNEYDPYKEREGYINWLAGFNYARLKMEGKL